MTAPKKTWLILLALGALSVLIWHKYTAPQLSFIDLSVSKQQALAISEDYISRHSGIPAHELRTFDRAIVFRSRDSADQYLQQALGHRGEMDYLKTHGMELFLWSVRYFKELQKEEFRVHISAATGEVLAYSRAIEASAARPFISETVAQQKAADFLSSRYGFNPQMWSPQTTNSTKLENRVDYQFVWEKNDSKVLWSPEPDTGWAIIQTGVTVSGEEVLGFFKESFILPEQYQRHMDKVHNVGRNLSLAFRIIFYVILTLAIFYVLVHKNSIVMHNTKNFAIGLTLFIFVIHLASYFNDFESVYYNYPTTSPMNSYLWRNMVSTVMNIFISSLSVLLPCLAAEALHRHNFPGHKGGSFLFPVRTTFFSRQIAAWVMAGYLCAVVMIGLQSVAFELGQRYLGVWFQHSWMAQMSGSYWPFLTAFVIGSVAGIGEEIMFRSFGITAGRHIFKNLVLACIVSSLIWGYGHSGYPVYPMWFRGLEVTFLGFFLAWVYLRFGVITVIVTHFLFNVFWASSAYLLGQASPTDRIAAIIIILLPCAFAIIAYIVNKPVIEKPLRWNLNKHQLYNLAILRDHLVRSDLLKRENPESLKKEIASHGWDLAVVEMAIEDAQKEVHPNAKGTDQNLDNS